MFKKFLLIAAFQTSVVYCGDKPTSTMSTEELQQAVARLRQRNSILEQLLIFKVNQASAGFSDCLNVQQLRPSDGTNDSSRNKPDSAQ